MDDDHRELVRRLWSANIATYSRALQTFCHEALELSLVVAWRAERGGGRFLPIEGLKSLGGTVA